MTKKYQLKNGLNVLLVESKKSPVVSVQMCVRTGSADESKAEAGISHFIEHLVFKGTEKFKVGEIASTVEAAGGELNAYTSFDQTVFYVTVSSKFLDTGLDIVSQMMGFPLFDPTEVHNEREVVVEEIKKGKDSLGRKASQSLFSAAYGKHPYGIPVIGYEKNVRGWSVKKIKSYFESRYNPKNMFLVVSGDIDTKTIKTNIEKYYGNIPVHKLAKKVRPKVASIKKTKIQVDESTFEQSIGYMSWQIPKINHKDMPALELLSLILGYGDTSRLVHKLRIEKPVVNSIGCGIYNPLQEGQLMVSFGYNKDNLTKILPEVLSEIQKMKAQGPQADEIARALINLEAEQFFNLETVDGLAQKVLGFEFYLHNPDYFETFIKKLKAVTTADIQKVAQKYLTLNNCVVAVTSNDKKANVTKIINTELKAFKKIFDAKYKAVKPQKAKVKAVVFKPSSAQPKIEKIKLPSGVNLLLRKSTDTPVVSVKAAFLGGSRLESEDQAGLTELLGRTWMCGTKNRTELEIYKMTEENAASISPVAGRNSVGLGASMLSSYQDAVGDLYLDVLTNPLFEESAIEREKQIQLESIKSKKDNPSQLCSRQFMKGLFGHHPYGKDLLGEPEDLAKMSGGTIKAFWQKFASNKNLTMVITGNFDEKLWIDKINKALASFSNQSVHLPTPKLEPFSIKKELFMPLKKEQTNIIYGFRGLTLKDEDRYALEIIESILAGQGGRLFIELRDKNSLAYSVSPMRMEGLDTGYFASYIGCSPEKKQKSIDMLKAEFDKLCSIKVGHEELERAKRYLIGRHDIDLQRASSVASAILYDDIYGIDYNEVFNSYKKYEYVTADQIMKVSQKVFSQPAIISVVGQA